LAIYGLIPVANLFSFDPIPTAWKSVLVWGGLRGSLSMVLIVTLPAETPGKDLLVHIVFGVVGFSLFLQGMTMKPLLHKLGLLHAAEVHEDYERARAQVMTSNAAIEKLGELRKEGVLAREPYQKLRGLYEARRAAAEELAARHAGHSEHDEQLAEGLRRLAAIERETVRKLVHTGIVSEVIAEQIDHSILERSVALEHSEADSEALIAAFFEGLASIEGEGGEGEVGHPTAGADDDDQAPTS